jgi:phage repressor protein C with HTH and peptisase S24 domain
MDTLKNYENDLRPKSSGSEPPSSSDEKIKALMATRRKRLVKLLENRTVPAREKSYVSQLVNGKSPFGEKAARRLEGVFGMEDGYLDRETDGDGNYVDSAAETATMLIAESLKPTIKGATAIQSVNDQDDNPDLVRIRRVKLKLSAGISGFSAEPEVEENSPIFFRADWLRRRGYKNDKLIALQVRSDSMEPGLYENDTVVVNTADIVPADGEVFAINYEGEPVIKRMQRDAGAWWLSSDNPNKQKHPRKECVDGLCIIIGRVVHKQSERI